MLWDDGGWSECLGSILQRRERLHWSLSCSVFYGLDYFLKFILSTTFVLRDGYPCLGFSGIGTAELFGVLGDGKMDTCLTTRCIDGSTVVVAVNIYTLCEYPIVDHTQMEDG